MDIVTAIEAWNTLLESVTYTHADYGEQTIKTAYYLQPEGTDQILRADLPAAVTDFAMPEIGLGVSLQQLVFDIHTQIIIHDNQWNVALKIATGFVIPIVNAWRTNLSLSQTVSRSMLRGGLPTIGETQWAGLRCPALELYLQIWLLETATIS